MKKPAFLLNLLLLCALGGALQAEEQSLTAMPDTPAAPDFTLDDMDGNTHRLRDYLGQVVVINFWATWCPPCRREMPSMERAWQQIKGQDVMMMAIDVGEDEDTVFKFTANYPVSFPLLLDLDSEVVESWPVKGLPTTYVVDPEGRIVYQAIGGREWDDPKLLKIILGLRQKTKVTLNNKPQ